MFNSLIHTIDVPVRDPIDGNSILSDSSRRMLLKWCYNNCLNRYWITLTKGTFESNEDAILFKLVWGYDV